MYGTLNTEDSDKVIAARRKVVDAIYEISGGLKGRKIKVDLELAEALIMAWQAYDAAIVEQDRIREYRGPG